MKAHDEGLGGPYHLSVAEDVGGARLKSAVLSAADAGWPLSVLALGEKSIALHALLPGKPAPVPLSWPSETLLLLIRRDSVELLRAHAAAPQAPERSFEDESATRIGLVAAGQVSTDVPPLLRSACGSGPPCSPAALVVADDAPFSLVGGTLKALTTLPLEQGRPDVQLRVRQPESPGTIHPVEGGGIGPTVSGRLAPELISKTIRASSDQLHECYEAGRARDPKLIGRVYVRFLIGRDGKVAHATTGAETTMPDARVTDCVVRHFRGLEFPAPEGGTVFVTYPLLLAPSE
jgi:hypothetical protein